jgi:hypothetical protein
MCGGRWAVGRLSSSSSAAWWCVFEPCLELSSCVGVANEWHEWNECAWSQHQRPTITVIGSVTAVWVSISTPLADLYPSSADTVQTCTTSPRCEHEYEHSRTVIQVCGYTVVRLCGCAAVRLHAYFRASHSAAALDAAMVFISSFHVLGLAYARPQPAARQKVWDGSSRTRPQCTHSVMLVSVALRCSALNQLPIRWLSEPSATHL